MHHKTILWLLALLPLGAGAQSAPPTRPSPLDAQAAPAPLVYRSAFAGYRRFDAESAAPTWREANDAVERIGGWRAYAREANAPDAAASAPKPAPAAPAASAPPAERATRPAPPPPAHRH